MIPTIRTEYVLFHFVSSACLVYLKSPDAVQPRGLWFGRSRWQDGVEYGWLADGERFLPLSCRGPAVESCHPAPMSLVLSSPLLSSCFLSFAGIGLVGMETAFHLPQPMISSIRHGCHHVTTLLAVLMGMGPLRYTSHTHDRWLPQAE